MGTCNWSYRGDGSATPRGNANLNKDYKNFFKYGSAAIIGAGNLNVGDHIVTNARGTDGRTKKDKWNFIGNNGQKLGSDFVWGSDVVVTSIAKSGKTVKVEGRTESGSVVRKQFKRSEKTYIRTGK